MRASTLPIFLSGKVIGVKLAYFHHTNFLEIFLIRFLVVLPEKSSSFRQVTEAQVLRHSCKQHLPSPVPSTGAYVDYPVHSGDRSRRCSTTTTVFPWSTRWRFWKPLHIPAVEAGGGLIQNVDIPGGLLEALQAGPEKILRPIHEGQYEPGRIQGLGRAGYGGAGRRPRAAKDNSGRRVTRVDHPEAERGSEPAVSKKAGTGSR